MPAAAPLPYARPGEAIDIVAPASACRPAELAAGAQALEAWGFRPRIPPDLLQDSGMVAAPDETRYRILRDALERPDSNIVWCVRGGYGSQRLLPLLARDAQPARPKLLVGFSDITALHVFFNQHWGWTTLHAVTLVGLGSGRHKPFLLNELKRVISGRMKRITYTRLLPINDAARREARAIEGPLVGGNFRTLQSLIGTPWELRMEGCLLMLEDVGERGYAIDRMLVQLAQSGRLSGVRGILFGQFTGGREPDGRFTGRGVILRFAEEMRLPVLSGAPFGHRETARALPLGLPARLELLGGNERARLRVGWERV